LLARAVSSSAGPIASVAERAAVATTA